MSIDGFGDLAGAGIDGYGDIAVPAWAGHRACGRDHLGDCENPAVRAGGDRSARWHAFAADHSLWPSAG